MMLQRYCKVGKSQNKT